MLIYTLKIWFNKSFWIIYSIIALIMLTIISFFVKDRFVEKICEHLIDTIKHR